MIKPARSLPEVEIAAVAARDPGRATAFAARHRIPQTFASYTDLLADRGRKPMTSNAAEVAARR